MQKCRSGSDIDNYMSILHDFHQYSSFTAYIIPAAFSYTILEVKISYFNMHFSASSSKYKFKTVAFKTKKLHNWLSFSLIGIFI